MTLGSKKWGPSRALLAIAIPTAVIFVALGIAVGCSTPTPPDEKTATTRQALASTNGFSQNGLTTNGLVSNGAWFNGVAFNGAWFNGAWFNGAWFNGAWFNGAWFNGAWFNGIFSNNLWSTGIDPNGGPAAVGSPAAQLQSSAYLRQLLPYIYGCAMPGKLDPITNLPIDQGTYDTTLDPNNGALKCAPPGVGGEEAGADGGPACDAGYTCSPQGTCVIALHGEIGLAINADGSSWWGETAAGTVSDSGVGDGRVGDGGIGGAPGTCDESCQRWVSACVLARTNAYGAHVEISMRAPADAPQAIKNALAVSDVERNGSDAGDAQAPPFSQREGAYYGNIFETAPVPSTPPDAGYTGPPTGLVVEKPAFYACAGPESNIPEITKRFCSSQGDQVVIGVPGVCLAATTDAGVMEPGTCAGEDTDASSPTFGAVQDCFTSTNPPNPSPPWLPTPPQPPVEYTQVITVYLKQPIAVCGNGVCETGEDVSTDPVCGPSVPLPCYCPSDCHPATWARDYAPNLGYTSTNVNTSFGASGAFGATAMSAVAPDNSIVVAGVTQGTVNLGGAPLSSDGGAGVLAEYQSDGGFAWQAQFGNTSISAPGGQLQQVNGVTVASSGNVTVSGTAVMPDTSDAGTTVQAIWLSTYSSTGTPLQSFSLPVIFDSGGGLILMSQALAVDQQGNIFVGAAERGNATLGSFRLSGTGSNNPFIAKISPAGDVLSASGAGFGNPFSLALDAADNIVMVSHVDSGGNPLAMLTKSCGQASTGNTCADGSTSWTKSLTNTGGVQGSFSVATLDSSGNVYATGYFGSGQDFGLGPITIGGIAPFVAKYDRNGNPQWVKYPNLVCAGVPNCDLSQSGTTEGVAVTFDLSGNVIFGSVGDPLVGGGIDFGSGTFPTYAKNNIFLSAYTPAGGFLWAKQIPTILGSQLLNLSLDSQGQHAIVSGVFGGSMQVDGQLLLTEAPEQPSTIDAFLASFAVPSTADTTPPCIGNIGTCSSPSITVPKDIFVQATSQCGAPVFFMPPTAVDTGDPDGGAPPGVSVSCTPPPNTIFPISTPAQPFTPVTCTATNSIGNHSSATFKVTVVDTLPPVFTHVSPAPTQATGPGGAAVTYTPPSAIDQVDCSSSAPQCTPASNGCITPVCTPAPGSTFPIGSTPVTCTAADAHGNASSTSFTVTVNDAPPAISVSVPTSTAATSKAGAVVTYSASATDFVDGTDPVTCSPPSGSTFPIGSTPVTCTATNSSNLTTTTTFSVVVVDTTPPVMTVPSSPLTVAATSKAGANVTFSASATDMVDGTDPVTCTPPSDSTFPIASTPVTCTATNSNGLSASATFTVIVADITPPTITVPANITTASTSASGAVVSYTATAVDPVDGPVTPVCTPASGSKFAIGTTTVTCTATDSAKNTSSASFTVTVVPNIGSFAVYATEAVELNSNSSVMGCNVGVENGSGPFLAGGASAYLSSGAKIQSSQTLFASSVYLNTGASIGPVYTNRVSNSTGATYGKVSTFPTMPAPPVAPSATAGTTPVTVSAGASKTLASGDYGAVTVNSGATLKLTGGTYVFASLTLSSGATLTVSAPTVLSVTGAASFVNSSYLGPASGSGLTAKALAVYFDASSGVNVSTGAKIRALFVAPKALMTVSTSSFVGAVSAAQVLVNAGATVACEDGLGSLAAGGP